MIEDFPGIKLISLDLLLARRTAQIAVEHRLRGADAAYVAVADAFDAALISWDQEMLKRCPAAVATMTQEGWRTDRLTGGHRSCWRKSGLACSSWNHFAIVCVSHS